MGVGPIKDWYFFFENFGSSSALLTLRLRGTIQGESSELCKTIWLLHLKYLPFHHHEGAQMTGNLLTFTLLQRNAFRNMILVLLYPLDWEAHFG